MNHAQTNTEIPYAALQKKVSLLERECQLLREQLRLLRASKYTPSSEKSDIHSQQMLFIDNQVVELDSRDSTPHASPENERKAKRKGKREIDLSRLPLRRIDYEIAEEERICPSCGGHLHEMDTDVRRELEYIPAKLRVVEHATHIYACRHCQAHSPSTPIIKPPAPKGLFPSSLASASLLAKVIMDKYVMHLPLYRQEATFGLKPLLSRQTLSNWIINASDTWLLAIYDRLKAHLLKNHVLHADETTLQVLHEENRKATDKSYMWLYRTSGCANNPCVIYDYQTSRSSAHPHNFLSKFEGWLHADGYSGYHKLEGISNIHIVGCWAHARRKFDEALKATPEKGRAGSIAAQGLAYINRLFAHEKEFLSLSACERYVKRLELSVPIAKELNGWASTHLVLPESLVGKAIKYLLTQWPYLMRVFEDGRLELSNNRAERSIKPFVIGRKNWLFSNTPNGARASAVMFSIIETAKENCLNVYEYLKYLFEQLPNITISGIDGLMPWSETLPDYVKVH